MSIYRIFALFVTLLIFSAVAAAQADQICGEATGAGTTWLSSSFVYGRVLLNGFDQKKLPKVTLVLADRKMGEQRYTIGRSGNYCFRDVDASGGSLAVEVEGFEILRRSIAPGRPPFQVREDFELFPSSLDRTRQPGAISAKDLYQRSDANTALFEKAVAAESEKQPGKALEFLKQIVANDAADFVVWEKIGSILFEQQKFSEAEAAYVKAIAAKPDHTPALINLGRIYLVQKQLDKAIEVLQKAVASNTTSARSYQLLGEAYILARKGTLGVEALNEALRLDPVGMAQSHLLMARLYDVAGAKSLASREYRLYLEKVPNAPDRSKFEKYIKDNPEQQ